jgi:hypothetical protein
METRLRLRTNTERLPAGRQASRRTKINFAFCAVVLRFEFLVLSLQSNPTSGEDKLFLFSSSKEVKI